MQRFRLAAPALAIGLGAWLGAWLAAGAAQAADPVADFYSGKSIQLVIGYAPGGGYDIYARALARHMGRHVPGNPSIVVQNMPGAGSIKAANYLYNLAPKDGTTFGGFSRGAFLDPLLGNMWRRNTAGSAASRTRSASARSAPKAEWRAGRTCNRSPM